MDKTMRSRITIIAVLIVLSSVVFASGCVGVMDPTPKEVKIRDNIICVDSDYISDTLIWGLCFDPNSYENELFKAVENYLPNSNPVIEVGAGFGAVTAYINDRLILTTDQISVEPNPYLIPCLEKTKQINELGCTFVQKAVAYGSDKVQISVSDTVMNNKIVVNKNLVDSVEVDTTTLQQLAESSQLSSKTNLTIVIDVNGLEHTIIQRESVFIRDSVNTLIASVVTENKNTPETFAYVMGSIGFNLTSNVYDETSATNIMVFQKQ